MNYIAFIPLKPLRRGRALLTGYAALWQTKLLAELSAFNTMKPHLRHRPRLFHAYCAGLPKTGTTSIGNIFAHYRSLQEYRFREALEAVCRFKDGKTSKRELREFVRRRDDAGRPEMDSSCINYLFMDELLCEFPDAKFIFTVRDCYSWCDSIYNTLRNELDNLKLHACETDIGREIALLGKGYDFDYGMFRDEKYVIRHFGTALEEMLKVWSHFEKIMARCPASRRIIIRTNDISGGIKRMAGFLGIMPETLISERSHSNITCRKHNILRKADPAMLKEKFDRYVSASSMMKEFFPEAGLKPFLGRTAKAGPAAPLPKEPRGNFLDPADTPSPGPYPINFWLNQAEKAVRCGRRELAKNSLVRAEGMKPESDELQRIASLYMKAGESPRALNMVCSAGNERDIGLWLLRAETAASCGRSALAKHFLGRAQKLKPGPDELRRMAELHLRFGEPRRALEKARRLTACRAHDLGSWLLRTEAEASCGRLAQAKKFLAYSEKLLPEPDALPRMAGLYLRFGEPRRALEKARQLTNCRSEDIDSWLLRAAAEASCARRAEAKRSLARAEKLKPGPDARRRIAALYLNFSNPRRAS